MQPIVDVYGGGYGGGGGGSRCGGPTYVLHSSTAAGGGGTQKDAVSWCSADGNDYAYVEDLVYPPPGPPAAPPAQSPWTTRTAGSGTGGVAVPGRPHAANCGRDVAPSRCDVVRPANNAPHVVARSAHLSNSVA